MKKNIKNIPAKESIIKIVTANRDETVSIGAAFGTYLKAGDIICLEGDLGAGKTVFTSGIAQGMGIIGIVHSPTFTILIEHDNHGNYMQQKMMPLYHFDAYRLEGEQDFYDLGFDEYFSGNGVCVIEWADKIKGAIPQNAIHVVLRRGFGETSDWCRIHGSGETSDRREFEFIFGDGSERWELFLNKIRDQGLGATIDNVTRSGDTG